MDQAGESITFNGQTVQDHLVIFEIGEAQQNKFIGAFGVPDSEVFDDNLAEDEYQTVLGDCEIISEDLNSTDNASEEFENYFADANSPARACFPVVSTVPYLSMGESDICTVAAAYRARCDSQGARINIPRHCDQNLYFNSYAL